MSTPSRARRSHGGCWTCKAKHRKCDRTRPTCQVCTEQGIPCDGYEVRLRWGSGIASRGHYTGAEAPVDTSIPPRVPGRRRDRNRARRREQEGEIQTQVTEESSSQDFAQEDFRLGPVPFYLSGPGHGKDDAQLFQEFLSSGINILHSTTVHDEQTLLKPRLPVLCQQSEALYRICIALQASLNRQPAACSLEYLDLGLNKFRAELSKSEDDLEDGTLTAGLLLCTIGVMHGIPWTMHLRGMYSILRIHDVDGPHKHQERDVFRAHLFEVMGIMDLPTFSIGRRHPHLGFWRQYCCKGNSPAEIETGVEVVTGLPRSLVTIFAFIGEGTTETSFWDWPGAKGTFMQCQLWEAYRLAGVLVVRHGGPGFPRPPDTEATKDPAMQRGVILTPTMVIVSRLLSSVDAVCRASLDPERWDTLIINAIAYPVCVAGLQSDILQRDPTVKEFIRKTLLLTAENPYWNRQYRLLLDLLEEYWTYPVGAVDIDQLARARGIELGLF
ncbi:hypothetical protein CNMCM6069_004138 [Aspergillus lentulus]|nr:hypothetical protein CNMCM6069_004138 [Aspergillus lentulus]KAF4170967.1 hypothetical protein CNMCM8060_003933 [Aspergillus lentulus]KAF4177003.1 hypothetical protein CNMCM7927_003581 [Aspergillus lentulus]KAF4189907.1 hypothetical protein CNMCM8694_003917 [Aspergillus lentulus]GFF96094.1 hypothetical protein IFM47457_10698 [Aspergillus lentulus]